MPPRFSDRLLIDEQVAEHAKIVSNALRSIGAGAKKRPYSLATKYLHFLLPDLFVIYDSQAAMSIWMWSLFAYGEDQPEIKALAVANLSSTDGDGYVELMRFYHRVWHSTGPELRDRAMNASQSLESLLSSVPGCKEARVSVLDLIDKHLWKCNGDPIRLGLAMPP